MDGEDTACCSAVQEEEAEAEEAEAEYTSSTAAVTATVSSKRRQPAISCRPLARHPRSGLSPTALLIPLRDARDSATA